jgi:hypothetical protein
MRLPANSLAITGSFIEKPLFFTLLSSLFSALQEAYALNVVSSKNL